MQQLQPSGTLKEISDADITLAKEIGKYYNDPLGFVRFIFQWGVGELKDFDGPDTWQVEFLSKVSEQLNRTDLNTALRVAVSSGHGVGKGNCVDQIIDTPSGPIRWGDLRTGDSIFGSDGKPTLVTAIYDRGVLPVYKVTFDDGSFTTVDGDHLWNVKGRQERRNNTDWKTVCTRELIKSLKRKNGKAKARQYEIPVQGAAQFTERKLSIDPYVMGVWLGDGSKGQTRITTNDSEIHSEIGKRGYQYSVSVDKRNGTQTINLLGVRDLFREYTEYNSGAKDKKIPDDYKYNLISHRADLLRGLLDTDGTCSADGQISFTSISKTLAEDVAWLVRSLGGKARLNGPNKSFCGDKECNPHYDVQIIMPDGFQSFYVSRKQARVKKSYQARYLKRWIDSIELVGEKEVRCITVSALDRLYLCNDFIVTHNTALVSWIILWFISTRPKSQIIVTANTAQQLSSKSWRELSKWARLSLNRHWFTWTATAFYHNLYPELWRASAIPWSKDNSEAFAGTHETSGVLFLFDEASAIDDIIWDVSEGAMTTEGSMWFCFGNPTRSDGKFHSCFHEMKHRWITYQVDSRKAKMANKLQLEEWIQDYGEDSDFVKVRIKGEFPKLSANQFISADLVEEAVKSKLTPKEFSQHPTIIGVDVARFGDDESVIIRRQGQYMFPVERYRGLDNMSVAGKAIEAFRKSPPGRTMICVDGVGLGAGVIDRLKQLGFPVIDVQSAEKSIDIRTYGNKRGELWGRMKDWLMAGGKIPNDKDLIGQLTSLQFGLNKRLQIILESKADIKKREGYSPDLADALAYTFAYDEAKFYATNAKARRIQRINYY